MQEWTLQQIHISYNFNYHLLISFNLDEFHYISSDIGDQKWPNTHGLVQFSAKRHQVVHLSPYNPCQVCKRAEIQSSKSPQMTGAIFDLRVNTYSWDFFWDESRSIGSHQLNNWKSKKFHVRKNSQPLPKMTLRNWGFWGVAQLKMAEMEKIGKNGLSINEMKGKVL